MTKTISKVATIEHPNIALGERNTIEAEIRKIDQHLRSFLPTPERQSLEARKREAEIELQRADTRYRDTAIAFYTRRRHEAEQSLTEVRERLMAASLEAERNPTIAAYDAATRVRFEIDGLTTMLAESRARLIELGGPR